MTNPAPTVDLATLEIIESALLNIREEMDAVVLQSAMSPIIREQHDEFPLVTDAAGNMLVGQFGSYVPLLLETFDDEIRTGDVILQSDPYLCGGAIQHTPDWLVLAAIDYEGERVGYASMFGHVLDCGGTVPGSMAATATSIWDEGIRIPPVKLFAEDRLNTDVLKIILNNSRTPEMNEADLMALVAACRTAAAQGSGPLRPVRHRRVPAGLRRPAAAHPRRHGRHHRAAHPHRAGQFRRRGGRRRPGQRPVRDEADRVAGGRDGRSSTGRAPTLRRPARSTLPPTTGSSRCSSGSTSSWPSTRRSRSTRGSTTCSRSSSNRVRW